MIREGTDRAPRGDRALPRIRMLKTSQFYQDVIDRTYQEHPGLKDGSYREQYRALMGTCFYWADFWKRNLERTGAYDVEEVVVNAERLQKRWARENRITYADDRWRLEIFEAQVAAFRPEVMFFHDVELIPPEFRRRLRRDHPEIRLVIGWDGIAFNDCEKFAGIDLMLSCVGHVTDYYRRRGFETLLLPLAFEHSLLDRLTVTGNSFPVSFVGTIVLRGGGHHDRFELLTRLAREIDIDLWLSGSAGCSPGLGYLREGDLAGAIRQFAGMREFRSLLGKSRGVAYGLPMYQILADSKITLNSHIDVAGSRAGNMRLFEATGVGSCLLTDWKENLSDYFVPDVEVATYRSAAEAADKIRYLLAHESERRRIAAAGQARTLASHTFSQRAAVLDDTIRRMIGRRCAAEAAGERRPGAGDGDARAGKGGSRDE